MSTITKERIANLLQFNSEGSDCQANAEQWEVHELARIALASLEAEPVCVIDQSNLDYLNAGSDADVWPPSRTEMGDVLLYRTAPPAQVSVPDELTREEYKRRFMEEDNFDDTFRGGWNACRAAMLQGAENTEHLHAVKAAPLLNSSAKGIELQHADLQANDGGNSPVIPDGWVMVPVSMTPEQMRAVQIKSELGSYAVANLSGAYSLFREFWDVAVTAAPKQGVK